MRAMSTMLVLVLVCCAGASVIRADETEQAAESGARARLDAIRADLVELRFEEALSALEVLLADSSMTEDERFEAWVLRSETHAAFGDFDAAERDYGEILGLRPAFRPEPSLTPKKALERFERARKQRVGQLKIEIDPPEAVLTVDGERLQLDAEGVLSLVAGQEVLLHAEAPGFDAFDYRVTVEPNELRPVKLLLTPNARTVIVTTEPDGVEVWVDGESVGKTARSGLGFGSAQPAQLILEHLPLGEHVFELKKECFRSEKIEEMLTVDLLDRTERQLDLIELVPARSTLQLEGGPDGAEAFGDGDRLGVLPLAAAELCPGDRELTLRYRGRLLWRETVDMQEGREIPVRVESRPNLVLVGAESWPEPLTAFAASFNATTGIDLPRGADPTTVAGWSTVRLPADADLAIAVVRTDRTGVRDRWLLYSPILRQVVALEAVPETQQRPGWSRTVFGFRTVESDVGGSGLVAWVRAEGPAGEAGMSPGARLTGVGGEPFASDVPLQEQLLSKLDESGQVAITWTDPAGEEHASVLTGERSPWLMGGAVQPLDEVILAAWAVVDAIRADDKAPEALGNLAMLFGKHGFHEAAVDTWRRVRWAERDGVGNGTAQYYLGAALAQLGRDDEAIEAYRRAAASVATATDDDGPGVAPAAADRLVDLGVTMSAAGATAR